MDDLLERLRRFHDDAFPRHEAAFRQLVAEGQHPSTLFIGCSDSRLVPYLLTGAGPGELFLVRNVGAFVPPYDGWLDAHALDAADVDAEHEPPADDPGGTRAGAAPGGAAGSARPRRRWVGLHGTAAAIEFAVLSLSVRRIVVCGHSHCGAVRSLYQPLPAEARHLRRWLDLGREAVLPVAEPGREALRRTEQRTIVLQLERLMDYPMVRRGVEAGRLTLHGWHYVIEDGEVQVFDVREGRFIAASQAGHAGTGPFAHGPHEAPPTDMAQPPAGGTGHAA